jgi:pimeloyl-ACP methyl ester carboxylesterase
MSRSRAVLIAVAAALVLILLPWLLKSAPDRTVRSADRVKIAYHVEGRGEPTLVFVHGWSCDRNYWNNQVHAFAANHRVIAVDLAGHGASGRGRKEWTIPAFGADVAAVIRKENPSKVILIGHSMGGDVIVEAAKLCSGRVLGLIGADTFHDFLSAATPEDVDDFLQPFKDNFVAAAAEFVRTMFHDDANPVLVENITKAMSAAPPAIAVASLRATYLYRPAEALRKLKLPVKTVNSDMDAVNVEGNRTVVPGFSVKWMWGAGHFLQIENPAEFNRLLEETIAEIAPRRGPGQSLPAQLERLEHLRQKNLVLLEPRPPEFIDLLPVPGQEDERRHAPHPELLGHGLDLRVVRGRQVAFEHEKAARCGNNLRLGEREFVQLFARDAPIGVEIDEDGLAVSSRPRHSLVGIRLPSDDVDRNGAARGGLALEAGIDLLVEVPLDSRGGDV